MPAITPMVKVIAVFTLSSLVPQASEIKERTVMMRLVVIIGEFVVEVMGIRPIIHADGPWAHRA